MIKFNSLKFFIAVLYYKIKNRYKKAVICPCCNSKLDRHIDVDKAGGPQSGDYTICLYCLNILYFEKKDTLLKATDKQIYFLKNQYPDAYNFLIGIKTDLENRYFE